MISVVIAILCVLVGVCIGNDISDDNFLTLLILALVIIGLVMLEVTIHG